LIFPNSTQARCNQFSSPCQKLRPRGPGAADDPRYFQISVPCQPGNSGGALVDERGNVIGIVSAKLDASVALAASGALPENVNYAVKSSLLLSFLESVPAVSAKLKAPNTKVEKFEDVVKSAQDAAVLVLVYSCSRSFQAAFPRTPWNVRCPVVARARLESRCYIASVLVLAY